MQREAELRGQDLVSFLRISMGDPSLRQQMGAAFELVAMGMLMAGGSFNVREPYQFGASATSKIVNFLPSQQSSPLQLEPSVRCDFPDMSFVKARSISWSSNNAMRSSIEFLVPDSPQFQALDAFMLPNFLFQMTISKERELDMVLLESLLNDLPAQSEYNLYYVVPSDVFGRFKWTETNASKWKQPWANSRISRLRVLVLEIDMNASRPISDNWDQSAALDNLFGDSSGSDKCDDDRAIDHGGDASASAPTSALPRRQSQTGLVMMIGSSSRISPGRITPAPRALPKRMLLRCTVAVASKSGRVPITRI